MSEIATQETIQNRIFSIRDIQVMIDKDLAELYGVEPKRLGEQVKRNLERFPKEFRFQLNENEKNELVANCDRLKSLKYSTTLPYVFTEQGVSMLSAVLKSKTAIKISIDIINSFVNMRRFLTANNELFQRLELVEKKQITHEIKIDEKFEQVFNALENKSLTAKQGVFFDGQIFDAYAFISELIKKATTSITILDNYVDETVLTHLSKAALHVEITILTKNINKQLKLDVQKYNQQYKNLTLKEFKDSHDRFIIIDEKDIYHIGASLKDLGKKWFAFSLLEKNSFGLMGKIEELIK